MDAKEARRQSKEYTEELKKFKEEQALRDVRVHSDGTKIKYDPQTGTLKEGE